MHRRDHPRLEKYFSPVHDKIFVFFLPLNFSSVFLLLLLSARFLCDFELTNALGILKRLIIISRAPNPRVFVIAFRSMQKLKYNQPLTCSIHRLSLHTKSWNSNIFLGFWSIYFHSDGREKNVWKTRRKKWSDDDGKQFQEGMRDNLICSLNEWSLECFTFLHAISRAVPSRHQPTSL